jgi:hypothetical protein
LLALVGCVPPTVDTPRLFRFEGTQYIALYVEGFSDGIESNSDGSEMRVYRTETFVKISRGDGSQFMETETDKREALAVAVAYCAKIDLAMDDMEKMFPFYEERYEEDNAEWNFSSLCHQNYDDEPQK